MPQKILPFKPQTKPVYRMLAKHQVTEESWDLQELVGWLQRWAARFVEEFSLNIDEISLCVDWLDRRCYGHFRHGLNGFGLTGEIAINRRYLHSREPWEHLGTLLHELLHCHQEIHGKPGKSNYHNKAFRQKAWEYGLIIDARGCTQYEQDSPFFRLLAKYGVDTPALPPTHFTQKEKGQSKLKKWSCACRPPINVRVAVSHFRAQCLWCGELFKQQN